MLHQIEINWPFNHQIRGDDNSDRLLILLHGYQQNGQWMQQRFTNLSFSGQVIAPDGLFPVPYKSKTGWRLTYSWYFFEPENNVYVIEMDRAIEYLLRGLKKYLAGKKEVCIAGFSQGGYLAPFLAKAIPQTTQVIGLSCRFRSEKLTEQLNFRLHAIHGEKDGSVDIERAQACFDEIIGHGNQGSFNRIAGLGHEVNDSAITLVSRLLSQT